MKIRAKKDTKYEKAVKQAYDQLMREHEEAKDVIKDFCGVRPESVGYNWFFSVTAELSCFVVTFKEGAEIPKQFIQNKEFKKEIVYKVKRTSNKAKQFIENWRKKFKGINGEMLQKKFGIPIENYKDGYSSHWLPGKDEKGYFVLMNSSVLERMEALENENYFIDIK